MLYGEVNSEITDSISIFDRGFNYGDGVFTTAKIKDGSIELLEFHIERIQVSCDLLHITPPKLLLLKSRLSFLAKNYDLAVIKVLVTAGSGGRGYARNNKINPNVIITIHEYPKHYESWKKQGVVLGKSATQLGINPLLAGLKHLNRLEQVLIRHELEQTSYDDFLVFNLNEHLVEASSANVFWIKNNELYTPEVKVSGVAGLMRQHVINHIPNVHIVEGDDEELINADAVFTCNSVMGIVPVQRYLTHSYDIKIAQAFIKKIEGFSCA